ncbi:DNA polymerase III subunit epsilon [Pseudonocardiaceae bacterium YIM PH 21723]|nr:DNA polymerase III subunit epsilon [Pseudonocardiaceae bacterium YIM PH 21723]
MPVTDYRVRQTTGLTSWVAIDFETANPKRGSMCAVGMVAVEDGRPVDSFSTLVKPPSAAAEFSPWNMRVHGITAGDVAAAPTCSEVLDLITRFTAGRPLVAHNASFDASVLVQSHQLVGKPAPQIQMFCTMRLAKRLWPHLDDHKLPTVATATGFSSLNHHAALSDAQAAAHVMMAGLTLNKTNDLAVLAGLVGPGHC